jgi:hypothetical protein
VCVRGGSLSLVRRAPIHSGIPNRIAVAVTHHHQDAHVTGKVNARTSRMGVVISHITTHQIFQPFGGRAWKPRS